MLARQCSKNDQSDLMKQQESIDSDVFEKVSENIGGNYKIANPDSFIIAQYGFLRSIWANHFKNSLCQQDGCEDRIDRLNKIVAMMKGRIANRTHKQFQISENLRSCLFSQQLFKSKQQKSVEKTEIKNRLQGQFQRIVTQYIYQNPLFRKMKQKLQRSQMQRQNLLHYIKKIQKQKCDINKKCSKIECQKNKLSKKIKELTKKIIELGKKNVELGNQLLLSDYGLGMKACNESQGQDEYDLAQSIVLEHHQSQKYWYQNQGLKRNDTRRSLILQFDKINSVADTKANDDIQTQQVYQKDRLIQSKSVKIINKQKNKQVKKNINRSPFNSFAKQLNTQVDSSCIGYSIQSNQTFNQQISLNNIYPIQCQRQKNIDQQSIIFPMSFPEMKQVQDICLDQAQCLKQTLNTQCKIQQFDESISQYYTNSEKKMVGSASKLSISRSSGQSVSLRFSRKASGSKIRFGITPRDGNRQICTLRQAQKQIQADILKSLANPQVYKENQFYTKFTKLKAMKIRMQ